MKPNTCLTLYLLAGITPRSFGFSFSSHAWPADRSSSLNSISRADEVASAIQILYQHQPPAMVLPFEMARKSRMGTRGKKRPSSDRERLDHQFAVDKNGISQHDNAGEEEWEHMYPILQTFVMKHGKIPTPREHASLSNWCSQQYRFQRDPNKLAQLVNVGFWNEAVETRTWDEWFLDLLDHYVTTGQSTVPVTASFLPLAQWVHHQRTSSQLTTRQRQLLWSINFVESNEEAEFQYHHSRLVQLEQKQRSEKRKRPLTVRQWKKLQQQQLNVFSGETLEQGLFGNPSSVWRL